MAGAKTGARIPGKYLINLSIVDRQTGAPLYRCRNQNLLQGMLGAKGVIEDKLGIPIRRWNDGKK